MTPTHRIHRPVVALILCGVGLSSATAASLSSDPELTGLHRPSAETADRAEALWSGSAELGGNRSSGNADNANLNGKLQLEQHSGSWTQQVRLESQQASQNGNTTTNRSMAEWETTRAFSPQQYSFGVVRASHDPIAGYAYQTSVSAGLGQVFEENRRKGSKLTLEAGPGVRQSKQTTGGRQTEVIGRIAGHLTVPLTSDSRFSQRVTTLAGASNTELEAETGLSTSLTDHIALKLSYTILHNSTTLADKKPTDTLTAFSLQYHFK